MAASVHDGLGRGVAANASASTTPVFKSILLVDTTGATNLAGTSYETGATPVATNGNLLPAIVPVAGTAVSAYLLWEARRLGASTGLLLRMVSNVGMDTLISAVPVAGAVGDVFFRANLRNMALLRSHLERRRQ